MQQPSEDSAQVLAGQALQWLHRGEDAPTPESKRAAYEAGLALAKRAVKIDPNNADAYFAIFGNNGRLMLLDGVAASPLALLRARRSLNRALEINPNHTDALAAKGGMYRQLPWFLGGSLHKAAKYLARAVELDPNAVGARIELAETYCDMGRPEKAVPLLDKAAELAAKMDKQRQCDEARALLRKIRNRQAARK